MIFVTVGTHPQSFDRLIKTMDNLVGKGIVREEVVMEIGSAKHEPKHCKWFRLLPSQEHLDYLKRADIIITHGGSGLIINALKSGKPTIVVPRYRKFNEHVDDHQLELTRAMESAGRMLAAYDMQELAGAIKSARNFKVKKTERKSKIINMLERYISGLINEKGS